MSRPRGVVPLLLAAACGGEPRPLASAGAVAIVSGYAFPSIGGGAAAYLTLRNDGTTTDSVVEFASPSASTVMAHQTITDGGVSRMEMLEALPLPPGATVTMAPGGLHLMMESVRDSLKPGDTLSLTVRLARAGAATVRVPVRPFGNQP